MFQVNLRLILVSGKTKEFLFSPNESAGDIAQHVFDNWPEGIYLTHACCHHCGPLRRNQLSVSYKRPLSFMYFMA